MSIVDINVYLDLFNLSEFSGLQLIKSVLPWDEEAQMQIVSVWSMKDVLLYFFLIKQLNHFSHFALDASSGSGLT